MFVKLCSGSVTWVFWKRHQHGFVRFSQLPLLLIVLTCFLCFVQGGFNQLVFIYSKIGSLVQLFRKTLVGRYRVSSIVL